MDRRLFLLLNRAQHRVFRHVERLSDEQFGASVSQLGVLLVLANHPGARLTEVARELGLKKPAVTGLVNRMEAAGLIAREPCPEDGRVSRLLLTEQGRARAATIPPFITELNEQMMAGFSDDEIDVVLKFLNALLTRF
ncbi:MarR family winged helix-turn-helix transcriptional regulator [Marinobacter xestospongiae]|uniref:MarR family transcriptional regulator n=1 Tax=Marinobacter xestospongiae TaxID=994319 RepID=A0ABU3VXG0_9GAMM|nr:MarR family transcriptional regulator [Marinobacter xestospongiae]MDV2078939.1 MarR family transcriptional regulator [Marinobacter xestospongiae]